MKKLMVVAALVAGMVNVSNAACNETVPCSYGYRFKVMVRTTETCNKTEGCGPCGEAVTTKFRKPAIRKFMGMIYGNTDQVTEGCGKCGDELTCSCNEWKNAKVALYDYDNELPVAIESAELFQLNRVGCESEERNKAEMMFTLNIGCGTAYAPMVFSGFGLCGNRENKIALGSANGYCAGLLPTGTIEGCGPCGERGCVAGNNIWDMCSNNYKVCMTTAAYGKWTLVWDSSVAYKVGTNLTETDATTSWGKAAACKIVDAR